MGDIAHRIVETNGIRMHVAEQGSGPAVLLCHGFPESWYSWRHQLQALAAVGYRAVAPDMRGYGRTDRPAEIEKYTTLHHVGDMVGLLDALGEQTAVIVGHDWGAPVAWNCALMRPDRFRAVVVLSVPYSPRGSVRPTAALRQVAGDHFMYMLHFQEPGVAEVELEGDVRATLRRVLYSASGDAPPEHGWRPVMPKTARFLDTLTDPTLLPAWLTEADLDLYTSEFQRTGFRGGLSWYRAMDLTWELMAAYHHAKVLQPALFVAGDRDLVIAMQRRALDQMKETVPGLRRLVMLPGCGHWTQQERPAEVNAEMITFLRGLDA
ncbi:MAG: alpha/beta hydrolase [Candidatus Rokubacteria bacterium]|nr:alpha/beta hydrolase [Candidatus Rokubacteria bacterium]MBI2198005.1 alpha/beta hydrolase [Candidatus Rokubacteria bacterium]MBI3107380.1 alpha/beta hydrolase [Candidatus Rokubacteria bacterium]